MPNRRRILLINRRFQIRFSLYVCSWIIALSFAYPLIISNLFDYLIQYLALDPMGPALVNLEKTRQELIWLLVLMEAVLIGITFLISLFMSHRIAGPIYKLQSFLQKAKAGAFNQKLGLRKTDYFQELAPEFNQMIEAFQNRIERKDEGVRLAIPRIEKALKVSNLESQVELEAALEDLRESEKS